MLLKLLKGRLDTMPTTLYLLTYRKGKCTANCGFCPQARGSSSRADMLSRVSWPVFPTRQTLDRTEASVRDGKVKRVCVQALNYPRVVEHLSILVTAIYSRVKIPVSVSCQPLNSENMKQLAGAGAERISVSLDATTEELFEDIKGYSVGGPYVWEDQFESMNEAIKVFGKGKVSTHLIIGLGETETQAVGTIQKCADLGVLPALFAFTPIPGTALENNPQPQTSTYRRIQLARHLIVNGSSRHENMSFDQRGCIVDFGVDEEALKTTIKTGEPFLTSGCPNCNRPYYNERPSGPIYNYPRSMTLQEIDQVSKELLIH